MGCVWSVRPPDPVREHTVVFLHGLCLNQTSCGTFKSLPVARHGRPCEVVRLRPTAARQVPRGAYNSYRIDQLAKTSPRCSLPLKHHWVATLVGHSMGAMTALA